LAKNCSINRKSNRNNLRRRLIVLGNILVIIGVALAFLDLILWHTVRDFRTRLVLQVAVLFIGAGVLCGASGFLGT
jgi:hypothetical protein